MAVKPERKREKKKLTFGGSYIDGRNDEGNQNDKEETASGVVNRHGVAVEMREPGARQLSL